MDQDITGMAGIPSAEEFGVDGSCRPLQYITGVVGIPSGEAFPKRTGIWVVPVTIPVAIWVAY